MTLLAHDCARARESVSAHLDGELGERGQDHLETHLRVCPACAAWAEEVRDVTLQLRGAHLEKPLQPFIRPRLRRSWRVGSAVAVVSAAAVVATMFFASGRQNPSLRSLAGAPSRSDVTFDVAAGVVYPPHSVLGLTTLGVSLRVTPRPVRDL